MRNRAAVRREQVAPEAVVVELGRAFGSVRAPDARQAMMMIRQRYGVGIIMAPFAALAEIGEECWNAPPIR